MVLAAQKKAKEEEAAAQAANANLPNQGATSADDFAKELEKQKRLEIDANTGKAPPKTAPGFPNTPVAAGQQQIDNGAGFVNNAGKDGAKIVDDPLRTGFVVPPAANNSGAGISPPRMPPGGTDGYPGQTEITGIGTGQRGNGPTSLGATATPPVDQFAQRKNEQPPTFNQTTPPNGANPPANSGPPPYGASPPVSVQPMAVTLPKSPPHPQQDDWDDDQFQSRAGDSWQSIARDVYRSDNYAQALMLYNRDYPTATPATQQHPETIVAGQKILVPPARILKRDYGSVILDQPATAPVVAADQTARPAAPTGSTTAAQGEKFYRVRGGGSHLYTIASDQLGNKERWAEIYKLNLRFDPAFPVPGGTVLRLPGDAKIDPADAAPAQ